MDIDIVIPVRDNIELTKSICHQLIDQAGWRYALIFDNGSTDGTNEWLRDLTYTDNRFYPYWSPGKNIYEMWNTGFEYSRADEADAVAFLNNDIFMPPNLILNMAKVLKEHKEIGLVYPDYNRKISEGILVPGVGLRMTKGTYRHGGMSGFCFMLRTAVANDWSQLIDPGFKLWYGDDDLAFSVEKAGYKQARMLGWPLDHIGSATVRRHPEVRESLPADKAYFKKKWGSR